jgi:hypothetical protein
LPATRVEVVGISARRPGAARVGAGAVALFERPLEARQDPGKPKSGTEPPYVCDRGPSSQGLVESAKTMIPCGIGQIMNDAYWDVCWKVTSVVWIGVTMVRVGYKVAGLVMRRLVP